MSQTWKESPMHYHLLMHLFEPKNIQDFDLDQWTIILGGKLVNAFNIFIQEKTIVEASLQDYLVRYIGYNELQKMARERKIKSSGKKIEVAERLIQTDSIGLEDLKSNYSPLFLLSDNGKMLVNQYQAALNNNLRGHGENVLKPLFGQIEEVKKRLISYCQDQLKLKRATEINNQTGISLTYGHFYDQDIQIIGIVFSKIPKVLLDINHNELPLFRLEAAFKCLFYPKNVSIIPQVFITNHRLGKQGVVSAIENHAYYIQTLQHFKKGKNHYIQIRNVNDWEVCSRCKEISKHKYDFDNVPELPIESCTSVHGCRCYLHPYIELEK